MDNPLNEFIENISLADIYRTAVCLFAGVCNYGPLKSNKISEGRLRSMQSVGMEECVLDVVKSSPITLKRILTTSLKHPVAVYSVFCTTSP